jgi:hypothetical protein
MSSKQNDTRIHLGNYEEFFILYMDNELNNQQRLMVEDFLSEHPDLRGELEMLMSTRLPMEELRIDKEELMASHMKMGTVDEALLLFIDNELTDEKRKEVALEIDSNKDYALQLNFLMKTKLDRNEVISYPDKAELYRRSEKVFIMKTWMRVAAIIIVMASFGVFYFNRNSVKDPVIANAGTKPAVEKKNDITRTVEAPDPSTEVAVITESKKQDAVDHEKMLPRKEKKQSIKQPVDLPAANDDQLAFNEPETNIPERKTTDAIRARVSTGSVIGSIVADNISKDSFNNPIVTSTDTNPYNNKATLPKPGDGDGDVASNDRKGSVKGFLRKASRLIEKRTGIDPVNDNGELLIGAVAVKLK